MSADRQATGRRLKARALIVSSLALACAVPSLAQAQQLRPGMAPRVAPAYDPTATTTGVGVGQPIDPTAVYETPSGAAAPGVTSRKSPSRATKPVKAQTQGLVQKPFKQPVRADIVQPELTPPPPPPRKKRKVEEDPYAALGVDVGGVTLRPAITESIGYDDNPERVQTGRKGSWLSRTEGELGLKSDWSRHELTGEIKGGYSRYFSVPDASRPDGAGKINLRLDATRDTGIEAEARATIDTQRPGSPELGTSVVGRPAVYGYGGTLGVSHNLQPVTLSLRGSADRVTYEDAKLNTGRSLSQADRDANIYGLKLRAALEVSPGFKPFVEAGADTRRFDQSVDVNGYKRSSDGLTGRVGASFELTRLLTGEASVGYQARRYEDPRLNDLRGLIADASLIWSATELTTVTLRGASEFLDTTIPGVNGAVARRAEVKISHALLRNVTLSATAGYSQTDYNGIPLKEDVTTLGAALDWKLSRNVAVRASYAREHQKSTAANSDYTANIYLVGLRLQL